MVTDKQLLLDAGLNQEMLAKKLHTKSEYVSMFLSCNGRIPSNVCQMLFEYFNELRRNHA